MCMFGGILNTNQKDNVDTEFILAHLSHISIQNEYKNNVSPCKVIVSLHRKDVAGDIGSSGFCFFRKQCASR